MTVQAPVGLPEPSAAAAEDAEAPQPLLRRTVGLLYHANWAGLLVAIVAVCVAFSLLSPYFATAGNVANIVRAQAYIGICASITTIVLIAGGIDLSIGANMSLSTVIAAQLMSQYHLAWWAAIAITLAVGLGIGLVNGLVIVRIGINALIATIATQFLLYGASYLAGGGAAGDILITNRTFVEFGRGMVLHVPVPGILVIVSFLVTGWILSRTRFGLQVRAIGGTPNGSAARLAGVNVARQRLIVYVLSGLFSAISGIVLAGYTGSGNSQEAFGVELTVIAAVIIGGTALGGGSGSVFGSFLGVVLLGVVLDGLLLENVPISWQYVTQGGALLVAVVVDEYRRRSQQSTFV
ncbi:MAG TPA: ABC transporter permease [Acidimicrobiales bacterium]|jgi:ribose transport system permease protein|nr:ABC transporter permease [Acidimicrobiales bacterium]